MSVPNDIMVSVCMITFNHEKYIIQAIEGVMMQQTTFPIELIIGEDCSTDNTRKICLEYKANYPELITLRLPESNLGIMKNFTETMYAANGKYIALCEGDDYWTDQYKLQKQVDFMEFNPEYCLSFHKVQVVSEGVEYLSLYDHLEERQYLSEEVYDKWTIPTCSVVFLKPSKRIRFPKVILFGDIYLYLSLLEFGKGYCHDFCGAVYRRNVNSVSVQNNIELVKMMFYQYKYMLKRFPKYKKISKRNMNNWLEGLIYAPYFKGIWKYRVYKMYYNPRLLFTGFFTTTLTSYTFKRKRHI